MLNKVVARFRKRITRRTLGKDAIKKSATLLSQIGNGSNPLGFIMLDSVSTRSLTGETTTVRDSQDTGSLANIGDVCKYVNICIEAGNRADNSPNDDDNNGFLEWGITYQQETRSAPSNVQLGTQTLGDVLTKTFRGNCLLTGCIPVGSSQPIVQDIVIKIPPKYIKVQQTSRMHLWVYFRSVNSTDLRTDSIKIILSCNYKLYV